MMIQKGSEIEEESVFEADSQFSGSQDDEAVSPELHCTAVFICLSFKTLALTLSLLPAFGRSLDHIMKMKR